MSLTPLHWTAWKLFNPHTSQEATRTYREGVGFFLTLLQPFQWKHTHLDGVDALVYLLFSKLATPELASLSQLFFREAPNSMSSQPQTIYLSSTKHHNIIPNLPPSDNPTLHVLTPKFTSIFP